MARLQEFTANQIMGDGMSLYHSESVFVNLGEDIVLK